MQAQIIRAFGEAEEFEATTLPDPAPGPGEVLVQTAATSVNPVDYKLRSAGPPIAPALPAVLGCDIAGRVRAVGEGVEGFAAGDAVYDATGGSDIAASFQAARLDGQVVTIVSQYEADLTPMHIKGLTLHVVFMLIPMLHDVGRAEHGRILREAAALADAGRLRPHLDPRRFDLANTADAHRHLESGHAVGKVVIDVATDLP